MITAGTLVDGKYEILAPIGAGAFGAVYAANQVQLNRKVAVKIVNTTVLHEPDGHARFEREAKAINALKHKNVVAFYGYGEWQQAPYMVMECVDGASLAGVLAGQHVIEPTRALRLLKQVFEGLAAAHQIGVVHRDLKPSNILVTKDSDGNETIKIIDFGLARLMPGYGIPGQKLTETGYALGTCHYMAPEQALGTPVDQRADIYAAGCIAYQMLTGNCPFDADNNVAIMFQHINDSPPPLSKFVKPPAPVNALATLVDNCLAKDPNDRYQTAQDAVDDIDALLAGRLAVVTPLAVRPRAIMKRHKNIMRPVAVIASACIAGFAAFLWFGHKAQDETSANGLSTAQQIELAQTLLEHRYSPLSPEEYKLLEVLYAHPDAVQRLNDTRRVSLYEHLLEQRVYDPSAPWTEAQAASLMPLAKAYLTSGHVRATSDAADSAYGIEAFAMAKSVDPHVMTGKAKLAMRAKVCRYIAHVGCAGGPIAVYRCRDCLENKNWLAAEDRDYMSPYGRIYQLACGLGGTTEAEPYLAFVAAKTNLQEPLHFEAESRLGRLYVLRGDFVNADKIRYAMLSESQKLGWTQDITTRAWELASFISLQKGDYKQLDNIWNMPEAPAQRAQWRARSAIGQGRYQEAQVQLRRMTQRGGIDLSRTGVDSALLHAAILDKTGHQNEARDEISRIHPQKNWYVFKLDFARLHDLGVLSDIIPPENVKTY